MGITKHCYRLCFAIPFAVGLLAQAMPAARADDVYPPGWNVRNDSVGPILYDFRVGCWGDYRRFWPEQKSCTESVRSRPIPYGPVVYQFRAGGHHRVEADGRPDEQLSEAR
jgi:hypothetical protein